MMLSWFLVIVLLMILDDCSRLCMVLCRCLCLISLELILVMVVLLFLVSIFFVVGMIGVISF